MIGILYSLRMISGLRSQVRNGNFHFWNLQVEISTCINGIIPLRVWRTMEISGNFHSSLWKFPFLRSQVSGLRIHRIHAAHLSYTWYFRKRVYPSVSLRMLFMYFRACTFKPMDREDSRPVATSRKRFTPQLPLRHHWMDVRMHQQSEAVLQCVQ